MLSLASAGGKTANEKQFPYVSPALAFPAFIGDWILLLLPLTHPFMSYRGQSQQIPSSWLKPELFLLLAVLFLFHICFPWIKWRWSNVYSFEIRLYLPLNSLITITDLSCTFQCLLALPRSLPRWFSLLRKQIPNEEYWADSTVNFPNTTLV